MKLAITKSTKNRVISLELETVEFSATENDMLDQMGEPEIVFEQDYGNTSVKFNKKIRSNFKVRVKFDVNLESDPMKTAEYIDEFQDDIVNALQDALTKVKDSYLTDFKPIKKTIEIKY